MEDTWTTRDMPALRAIVEMYEETGEAIRPSAIVAHTELDEETVQAALRALNSEDPPFVTRMQRRTAGGFSLVGSPTGHARRAVGNWPTAESMADKLVSALTEAAER